MRKIHRLHKGERLLQKLRQTPDELSRQIPNYIHTDMPQQHAEFYTGLQYLPLATLDDKGRPWASLLVTTSSEDSTIGIKVSDQSRVNVVAQINTYDPFLRALKQNELASTGSRPLFAGVGIDFSNRRRNKIAGTIDSVSIDSTGKASLNLVSNEHLGNCPKYITIRSLQYQARSAELIFDNFDTVTSPLPESCKALINQASTAFLATKHIPEDKDAQDSQRDMGLNHRGGSPGFVRVYEELEGEAVATYLVLPDHSGNRFYQSLGNIQTNKQVGLVFPDFTTGDLLYITGDAENLFEEDAEEIMPRVSLLTRVRVRGAVLVKAGLNLAMVSAEQHSPYNPPVKYLRRELEQMGHSTVSHTSSDKSLTATLVSTQHLSDSVSTFTFELSEPINAPMPGGFGVFDFSRILNSGYSHMDEINPQAVNEDYIRTWTLSSAPGFDTEKGQFSPTDRVSITVKRKSRGLISNFLHDTVTVQKDKTMEVLFKGAGGTFTCFTQSSESPIPSIPPHMLWVAGGVGITPFMSMWDGILNVAKTKPGALSTDITLLFAGRDDDLDVLKHFLSSLDSLPTGISLKIHVYQSIVDENKAQSSVSSFIKDYPHAPVTIEKRRLEPNDFRGIKNLLEREVFLCGPDALMSLVNESLSSQASEKLKIHHESYFF